MVIEYTMCTPYVSDSQREYYADVMRVCAAFGVIAYHAGSTMDISLISSLSPAAWWFKFCVTALCRSCVPIFIMLSGALLLGPKKNESLQSFFKKRIKKVHGYAESPNGQSQGLWL